MLTAILSAIQWQTRCISFSITDSHTWMSTQFSSWNLFPHSGSNYTSRLAVGGHLSAVFLEPPASQSKHNKSGFDRPRMSNVFWNSPFAFRRLPAEAYWLSMVNMHKDVTDKGPQTGSSKTSNEGDKRGCLMRPFGTVVDWRNTCSAGF